MEKRKPGARYFFLDTEFIERGHEHPLALISIGLCDEDGRSYYAISNEFDGRDASDWVREHVLTKLPPRDDPQWKDRRTIAREIREFVGDGEPRFVANHADYDWVVFCQLQGTMLDLPESWPRHCRDLKQWMDDLGVTKADLPPQGPDEHHALVDAEWDRRVWRILRRRAGEGE